MRFWAYILGLFLANVAVTCVVASLIVGSSPENSIYDLEEKINFNRFLEFIQSHTSGKSKWTALSTVVRANEIELARWMLQMGANTEVMDQDEWTAVHRAAETGSVPMLQLLAEYKADLKARNGFGDTALHIAIAAANVDAVKWLLTDGGVPADILSKNGVTPLYNAIVYYFRPQVSRVFPEILKSLLNGGADVMRISLGKETALHLAAGKGYVEPVKALLKAGTDVNVIDNTGATPLHLAARDGRLEVAKILVEHGANLKVQDKHGKTPVDLAKDDVAEWFKTMDFSNNMSSTTVNTVQSINEEQI